MPANDPRTRDVRDSPNAERHAFALTVQLVSAREARPLKREVRHPVDLPSTDATIWCHDEVVAKRFERSPSAIIHGTNDAQGASRQAIPLNVHLKLICDARDASQLDDLPVANQPHQVAVVTNAIPLHVNLEERSRFRVVHPACMSNWTYLAPHSPGTCWSTPAWNGGADSSVRGGGRMSRSDLEGCECTWFVGSLSVTQTGTHRR